MQPKASLDSTVSDLKAPEHVANVRGTLERDIESLHVCPTMQLGFVVVNVYRL